MTTPSSPQLPRLDNVTLIAGIGRSGTTWLGELINYDHSYRVLFEPLHKDVALHDLFTRAVQRYLPPQHADPALAHDLADAFTRTYDAPFVNQYATQAPPEGYTSGVMVKEIRITMLLAWLQHTFPHMPIVVIMRHPGAVLNSQLTQWHVYAPHLKVITQQPLLMHEHLESFRYELMAENSIFQNQLLVWTLSHYVLLRTLNHGQIHTLFYENLVLDPMNELKRLFAFLNRPFDEARIAQQVNIPSRMAGGTKAKVFSDLDRWRSGFNRVQLTQIQLALEMFGLDAIYTTHSTLPKTPTIDPFLLNHDVLQPHRSAQVLWRALGEARRFKMRITRRRS